MPFDSAEKDKVWNDLGLILFPLLDFEDVNKVVEESCLSFGYGFRFGYVELFESGMGFSEKRGREESLWREESSGSERMA